MSADRRMEFLPLDEIKRNPKNVKAHDMPGISLSMDEHGFVEWPVMDERTGLLIAGHGRLDELQERRDKGAQPPEGVRVDSAGRWLVPVARGWASKDDEDEEKYLLRSNQLTIAGGWLPQLRDLLDSMSARKIDISGLGWRKIDLDEILQRPGLGGSGESEGAAAGALTLKERFLVPPFSVLDARQGYWQDRKRAWLALGIESEVGRGDNLIGRSLHDMAVLLYPGNYSDAKRHVDEQREAGKSDEEIMAALKEAHKAPAKRRGALDTADGASQTGTSIFDPVLCELAYRWFVPAGGAVLDPFAGGSVRGVVAARLGLDYFGVDLRPEQVAANEAQAAKLCREKRPRWAVGDSQAVEQFARTAGVKAVDFVFSCPPYADLERYSDDPRDLSTMDYESFVRVYRQIIFESVKLLRKDRFACFVVSDIRGPDGAYRNFVSDTISAFQAAGAKLYNEAILVTSVGSLPIRAGKMFSASRKVGKTHQNVLVFIKGDARKATAACGPVEVAFPEGMGAEEPEATQAAQAPEGTEPLLVSAKNAQLAGTAEEADEEEKAAAEPRSAPGPVVAAPEWARGFPVERLRQIADVFRAYDKPWALGAFTGVKETTVAEWLAAGRLLRLPPSAPTACAVRYDAERPAKIRDFAGHLIGEIAVDDTVIKRIAALHAADLPQLIACAASDAPRAWLEIWQEDELTRRAAHDAGFEWVGSKVAASSEIIGVWARGVPGLAPPSAVEQAALVPLRLSLDAALVAEAAAALEQLSLEYENHYSTYNKRESWSALSLRGYGGDQSFVIKPSEMSKKWKAEHPAEMALQIDDTQLRAALAQWLEPLIEAVPGVKHRIRLMRLRAGDGELTRHADITDPDAGVEPGRLMRIHVPLQTNPGVIFRQWLLDGSQVEANMRAGSAWYLDTRKPHTAVNQGAIDRIHLVMDVESSPALLALLAVR